PFTAWDGVRGVTTSHDGFAPLVHHSFSPCRIHAWPSRVGTAIVSIAAGAEPTPGSVKAKAEIAPFARRGRYFFFWVSVPNSFKGWGTPIDWCAETSAVMEASIDERSSMGFMYDRCAGPGP